MTTAQISKSSTMEQVLQVYPTAQRALFQRYHIGGCHSCGFQPNETIEQVAQRNGVADAQEMLDFLRESADRDAKMLITVEELQAKMKRGDALKLLDVRSPEEHTFAALPGGQLVDEKLAQEILEKWPKDTEIVVHCHRGVRSLDAATFLTSRGFTNVKSLAGGIDHWSEKIDTSVPRYQTGQGGGGHGHGH